MRLGIDLFVLAAACSCALPTIGRAETAASAPAAASQVTSVAGEIKDGDKAAGSMGNHGCLLIRSEARWSEVGKELRGLGWEPPAASPPPSVNFDRQSLLCLFRNGDEQDAFSVRGYKTDANQPRLDVVMSYIIYKSHVQTPNRFHFLLVAVPKSDKLTVTVSTYHPMNGGPYPTADKAHLEWSWQFGPESGDMVDGLTGAIRPGGATAQAGQDVLVEFKLMLADAGQVADGHFAGKAPSVNVWDGKYSNGYRNHAFLVRTPDGKTRSLLPNLIANWDKNAPHPVQVTQTSPYVLPGWSEGQTAKSLKALGLDTSARGAYTITGIYRQTPGTGELRGKQYAMWGGDIATNTIVVEVK